MKTEKWGEQIAQEREKSGEKKQIIRGREHTGQKREDESKKWEWILLGLFASHLPSASFHLLSFLFLFLWVPVTLSLL